MNTNSNFIPKVDVPPLDIKDYEAYIPQMHLSKELLDAVIVSEEKDNIILQLKDEYYQSHKQNMKHNFLHHIPYHISKKPRNIDAYLHSPYHQELVHRYEKYSTSYKQDIIDQVLLERQEILKIFPEITQLVTKIRQKSLYSYEDKENQKILNNKNDPNDIFINDIIGARHIPYAVGDDTSEHTLIEYTSFIQLLLSHMHATNAEFSKYKLEILKDYIKNPDQAKSNKTRSDNGVSNNDIKYQSVHLIYYNKDNPDCRYEDQIRTPEMEFLAKKDISIGHYHYKPNKIGEDSPLRVPKYTVITTDPQTKKDVIVDVPFKDAFRHAYHVPIKVNNKIILYAISWEQYSEEQVLLNSFINEIKSELNRIQQIKKDEETISL